MAKLLKKRSVIFSLCLLVILLSVAIGVNGATEIKSTGVSALQYEMDTTSNFFTQVESKETIDIVDKRDELTSLASGYKLMCSNNYLEVYLKQSTCGLAVYDKISGYTWINGYQNKEGRDEITFPKKIQSGVIISYYNLNGTEPTSPSEAYFNNEDEDEDQTITCEKVENGFNVVLNFIKYRISFRIEVRIEGSKMKVKVPFESITEEAIEGKVPKDYRLKDISLFSYFGAENYNINGYSFIPDGSGALIRYNKVSSATAFVKKVYGTDYSFKEYSNTANLKGTGGLGLPIYGINHGYNQAAFLCIANCGTGYCELNSNPYNYKNIKINNTFFKYSFRDSFTVNLSSTNMTLINENPYPSDYELTYNFLSGEDANYMGMAECYRDYLNLEETSVNSTDIPLHLELLGLDYKPGLFGKKYVVMTKYEDALNIVKDLENNGVNNFALTYLGWNSGGYFNNGAVNGKVSTLLGGKSGLKTLQNYLNENDYSVDYSINPMVCDTYGFGNETVKKINLSTFEVSLKSSLEQIGYFINPNYLSEIISKKAKRYENNGISAFNISNLSAAYSYRYNSKDYYREEMINQMVNEINQLSDYKISTNTPNSYLYAYLENYYSSYYESNKYAYETDSIPFISILLSGSVNQYMPNINYVSNYNLAVLRMIEYNIYPSFILTQEEAYDLRYTNYEYLNSTQYALWKDLIVSIYDNTNNALKYTINARIIDHEYLASGIAKVTYDNGIIILVNYTNTIYNYNEEILSPYNYVVIGEN